MELLPKIDTPTDLRKLAPGKLPQVCAELREYLIDVISKIGGHFGSSLGATEIYTIAYTLSLHDALPI